MGGSAAAFHHGDVGTSEQTWAARPEWDDTVRLDLGALGIVRLVVLAAHPDDETLGAGGLIAHAADAGLEVQVLLLTRGEASHPGSATHRPEQIGRVRVEEARRAVALLAPSALVRVLDLPDGRLAEHEETVVAAVVDAVGEAGPAVLVCAPWRRDGHTDHEAAGRAAAVAAARTDARLLEYPIWWWLWSRPETTPWDRVRQLGLDVALTDRKARAIGAHRSQVEALSAEPGDEVLLSPQLLSYFERDWEAFVEEAPVEDDVFDRLHTERDDPWQVDRSWYEQRKRDLTLAILPRQRFGRALEIGCSTGALAARLAPRCGELLGVDLSAVAVAAAQARLTGVEGVRIERRRLPDDFPQGRWDLVVVSEVGYFLSPAALCSLITRVEQSLTTEGVVVLCHWWHEVRGWPLDGPRVHQIWRRASRLPHLSRVREADFGIDLLGGTSAHRHTSRTRPERDARAAP